MMSLPWVMARIPPHSKTGTARDAIVLPNSRSRPWRTALVPFRALGYRSLECGAVAPLSFFCVSTGLKKKKESGAKTPHSKGQGGPVMPLLEVRGLVKIYGRRRVVDGVDFEVNTGEVVGLLGPNGAGKTTSF